MLQSNSHTIIVIQLEEALQRSRKFTRNYRETFQKFHSKVSAIFTMMRSMPNHCISLYSQILHQYIEQSLVSVVCLNFLIVEIFIEM